MTILDIAAVKARREAERLAKATRRKKYQWRLMCRWTRVFRRIYRESCSCDYCIEPIFPGDEYVRRVFVNNAGWIRVERQHYPDCHAPTEEEYREINDQIEREREEEQQRSQQKVA